MKIPITKKQILFSTKPGTVLLIPKTNLKAKIYPTRIEILDPFSKVIQIISITTHSAIKNFIASLDLEKNHIAISGRASWGFFTFILQTVQESLYFIIDRCSNPVEIRTGKKTHVLQKKEKIFLGDFCVLKDLPLEKLSFGSHKSLDIEKIEQRSDIKEYLPLLYSLSIKTFSQCDDHNKGTAKLLDFSDDRSKKLHQFEELFKAGFVSFCPRLDDAYQGYIAPFSERLDDKSPMILLQKIQKEIRDLFFKQDDAIFSLLPVLLKPFVSGRFCNVVCDGYGTLDFEWSESKLRKVIYRPLIEKTIYLKPRGIKRFRIRKRLQDKGGIFSCNDPIIISDRSPLYFDRFEK